LPTTMECFYTAYDATVARDYFWDIQFLKVKMIFCTYVLMSVFLWFAIVVV